MIYWVCHDVVEKGYRNFQSFWLNGKRGIHLRVSILPGNFLVEWTVSRIFYRNFRFLSMNGKRKLERTKPRKKYHRLLHTPFGNRPNGIYILTGFSEKTSPGRQIFHQVAPFCQDAVLTFSNDMRWEYTGKSYWGSHKPAGWSLRFHQIPGIGRLNFHWVKGKIHWVGFHLVCCRGVFTRDKPVFTGT